MMSYCCKSSKTWINDISRNIKAVFLKLGTINVHHKRKLHPQCCYHSNYFGSSLSVQKPNVPIYNLNVRQKGPTWNRHSSIVVVTPINRLCGVDGSRLRKTGNFSFYYDRTSVKTVVMATALQVSFCFFCDGHMVPSFKNTV